MLPYNIPNTVTNKSFLQQAKTAISKAHLSDALQFLAQINIASVLADVMLLNARLAKHEQEDRQGVLSQDKKDRAFNILSRDTLGLVTTLEKELETGSDYQKTIKAYLLKRYTKRLDQKMASRQPINLWLLPTTEGTSEETSANFEPIRTDALKGHITTVFQTAQGRLLITGVPGAGKTSVLLELAMGLLEKEMDRLPVVLNLATWKKEYTVLETWLKEILPAELGVSKPLAVNILQQDQLIILFDGFDEIKDEDRLSCLEAIGRYGEKAHRQFVITSRIAEYKDVAHDAPVYQQIEVGVFTLVQMETELERLWRDKNQPDAKPLLHAIQQDVVLREAVEVPFYFNSLQLLFAGGKRVSDLHFEGKTVIERQAAITEQFVTYVLGAIYGQTYTPEQAKQYLSFLAFNMSKRNKVVFELVDLQYDWYGGKWSKGALFLANLVNRLVSGLVVTLIFTLVFTLLFTLIFDIVSYFGHSLDVVFAFCLMMLALYYSLLRSLTRSLDYQGMPIIETRDSINLSLSLYLKAIETIRDFGFAGSLAGGLGGILVVRLVDYIKTYNTTIIQITKPYERFRASMRVLYFPILQHYHLCYLLIKKGLLPSKIVSFLNAMTAQHILESDGATWRFRHRILQEYFAHLDFGKDTPPQ